MEKDKFLDTNVIFHYSNYNDSSGNLLRKCYLFITNKKGNFILCGAVLKELNEVIAKRARLHKAIIEKIKDPDYSFEESILISKKDIPFSKQIYEKYKNKSIDEAEKLLQIDRRYSEIRIEKFLNLDVDERVISLKEIDNDLVSKIHDVIPNHADCKILASSIQLQSTRTLFIFVTADGKDLDPNGYEYLKEHFKINYSNDKYKFPELLNLVFAN